MARLVVEGRVGKQSFLHPSAVVLLQIKSSMFHSVAIFQGGEGHGYMSAWGLGGILSLLLQQPSIVSPCEVTFEFTIPLRKAINSQINISPSLSL